MCVCVCGGGGGGTGYVVNLLISCCYQHHYKALLFCFSQTQRIVEEVVCVEDRFCVR